MMAPNIDLMVSLVYRYDFNMQIFQSISFNTSKLKKNDCKHVPQTSVI